ncbi:MAG: hypothetical protein K9L75_02260 [Spirochaetia bacterium]|nr:hypothetical protein [Spirochaetia bacterium]
MKKVTVLVGLLFVCMGSVMGEIIVTTPKEERVLLNNDGTYEFLDDEKYLEVTLIDVFEQGGDCYIQYDVKNMGYGTLHNYSFSISMYDENDRVIENETLDTFNVINLELGMTYQDREYISIPRVNPKDIKKIVITRVREDNFVMRMVPENVEYFNLIRTKSNLDGVSLEKP